MSKDCIADFVVVLSSWLPCFITPLLVVGSLAALGEVAFVTKILVADTTIPHIVSVHSDPKTQASSRREQMLSIEELNDTWETRT